LEARLDVDGLCDAFYFVRPARDVIKIG